MSDQIPFSGANAPGADDYVPDPTLTLIVDYCSGELTEEQAEQVDLRLATDSRFRLQAEPMVDAWHVATFGPPPITTAEIGPEVEARAFARCQAEVQRVRDRAGARMSWVRRRGAWTNAIAAALILLLLPAGPAIHLLKLNNGPRGIGIQTFAGHWFLYKSLVTAGRVGRTVDLGNNSHVALSPGTTFAYRRQTAGQEIASLTGDALLQIQPRFGDVALLLALDTTAWLPREYLARAMTRGVPPDATFQSGVRLDVIALSPGLYHVHTYRGDSTVVDVQVGTLSSIRGHTPQVGITFHDGDHVVITPVGFISYHR